MVYMRYSLLAAVALCVFQHATAQTVLIDPTTNNGSFEFAGGVMNTAKITGFDVTPDVDNWTKWTEIASGGGNSGIENTGNASDGDMIAFLEANDAIRNMTGYTASAGDVFAFNWDHVARADREHRVGLLYDDGGTFTRIEESEVFSTGTLGGLSGTYTIPTGSPVIGHEIGLGLFANGTAGGGYPEVDNFVLTVSDMPPVTGDVNGDFQVNLVDYGIIRDHFRQSPATKAEGDITGADIVDLEDFLLWRSNNPYPSAGSLLSSAAQTVPEPAAWLIATFALTAIGYFKTR